MQTVYLNGEFLPYEAARVPIDDRGFMLADGIYEVIRVYDGRPFEFGRHLARLERSAAALRLQLDPGITELERICLELIARNGLPEASIYIQVTRGAAPRMHAMPPDLKPTTLVIVNPATRPRPELLEAGARAITLPDDRWSRCDVKVIGLTANVIAKQRAVDAGAFEAIYVRDGSVTDCSSCNIFAVFGGVLQTAPNSNYILSGITREVVLELAAANGIPTREFPFRLEELRAADEVFVTGTSSEIMPITRLDGAAVADGSVGPVTRRLMQLFQARVQLPISLEASSQLEAPQLRR
jgi:D-alanine transaminase